MHQKVEDGIITAIVGSAGSGKTGWLKQKIAKADRLLVWDIEGQYTERMTVVYTRKQLVKAIEKNKHELAISQKTLMTLIIGLNARLCLSVWVQRWGLKRQSSLRNWQT